MSMIKEIKALRWFEQYRCAHTPHLLACMSRSLPATTDPNAMTGGFTIAILMTKLSGERLDLDVWTFLPDTDRDQIRQGFKTALMNLLKLRVFPRDRGLHKQLWDKAENKCYIVDFESYGVADVQEPDSICMNKQYHYWNLCDFSTGYTHDEVDDWITHEEEDD
ncbi:hypothetical protein B0J11DRAFT_20312 [Dendryphion nanum]|uniref:Uncharacterized protein n=1 Tax=Dendryphion nanum TaxID=256645 RepID=A0A9P9EK46_9PLEO|nr:hypothetical protein B0J11DRAFT_20312 [Dendryphion nanum]